MNKVLFIPLNTNHVLIFRSIIKSLVCNYEVLCHDRLCSAAECYTENALLRLAIPFKHFPRELRHAPQSGLVRQTITFFRQRSAIRKMLDDVKPTVIVLALDNDPISQIVIAESRRRGIKTVLIPEGLLRPGEFSGRKTFLSDYFYRLLNHLGVYLHYIDYGSGACDKVLVSGKRAFETLQGIGVKREVMTIVGQQKYDGFFEKISGDGGVINETGVFLYAASLEIFGAAEELRLVKNIAFATRKLNVQLIIKLHPRTPNSSGDLYDLLEIHDTEMVEIVKEGYDTYEILKKVDAVITIASTIVLEALIMNKECIVINYLAGRLKLGYDGYDAIHSVDSAEQLYSVIERAKYYKTSEENKRRLLEDELYLLDGRAGERAARSIEEMLPFSSLDSAKPNMATR